MIRTAAVFLVATLAAVSPLNAVAKVSALDEAPTCRSGSLSLLQVHLDGQNARRAAVDISEDDVNSALQVALIEELEKDREEREGLGLYKLIHDSLQMIENPKLLIQKAKTIQVDQRLWLHMVLVGVAHCLLFLVAALLYHRYKLNATTKEVDSHSSADLNGSFAFGLCSCFDSRKACGIFALSCCCPIIRWADTVSMAGLLGFWKAIGLMMLLWFVNDVSFGTLMWLVIVAVMTTYRQSLREKFKMEDAGSFGSIATDAATYCCCGVCAITQEARQLEEASATEHPVLAAA